ncbi:MAG: thymidine phosphorylase [Erysipelotrichaceae bacterium]|nr:thymidine phosphorylase [Erysipelotrichaceae bacterium]
MNIIAIIEKKAKNKALSRKEIEYFITNYVNGNIADYQASSLLMAIKLNGMNKRETVDLTRAMLYSGDVNDLSCIKGHIVDKHSTGGVGDKTTLVLAPLVAACGLKIAKMSGRGLGHTGGTIDKLESIPNFKTSLSHEDFISQVQKIGISVIGQTAELVPADKKLYALRDVTGTVDSMPLICSSIVSKKIASGAKIIELDVKYGDGAFMKSKKAAKELADLMIYVGHKLNRTIKVVISNMNEPLGNNIGNSLEVIESIETLKGNGPKDLTELCLHICAEFLHESKMYDSYQKAYEYAKEVLYSKKALEKFKEFVSCQGGNANVVDDYSLFKQAKYSFDIISTKDGIIKKVKALSIGQASMLLGGGRQTKDDVIDMSAGIVLKKKAHDKIHVGDVLATCYTDKKDILEAKKLIESAYVIAQNG